MRTVENGTLLYYVVLRSTRSLVPFKILSNPEQPNEPSDSDAQVYMRDDGVPRVLDGSLPISLEDAMGAGDAVSQLSERTPTRPVPSSSFTTEDGETLDYGEGDSTDTPSSSTQPPSEPHTEPTDRVLEVRQAPGNLLALLADTALNPPPPQSHSMPPPLRRRKPLELQPDPGYSAPTPPTADEASALEQACESYEPGQTAVRERYSEETVQTLEEIQQRVIKPPPRSRIRGPSTFHLQEPAAPTTPMQFTFARPEAQGLGSVWVQESSTRSTLEQDDEDDEDDFPPPLWKMSDLCESRPRKDRGGHSNSSQARTTQRRPLRYVPDVPSNEVTPDSMGISPAEKARILLGRASETVEDMLEDAIARDGNALDAAINDEASNDEGSDDDRDDDDAYDDDDMSGSDKEDMFYLPYDDAEEVEYHKEHDTDDEYVQCLHCHYTR